MAKGCGVEEAKGDEKTLFLTDCIAILSISVRPEMDTHLTALAYQGSGILPRSLWLLLVYKVNLLTMERISAGPSRWLDLSIAWRVQFCISGAINCSSQKSKWGATWSGLHIFWITWQGDTLIFCRSMYCIVGLSPLLFNISQASHFSFLPFLLL